MADTSHDSTESGFVPSSGATGRPARARLVIVSPLELSGAIELDGDVVPLGRRAEDGGPSIPHTTVSRRHVTLRRERDGSFRVEDHRSKNGTWIDGAALTGGERTLSDGVIVRLGDVVAVYEHPAELDDAPGVSRDAVPGDSSAARVLRQVIARAARTGAPVLISGETGTGKEHVARELHAFSGRTGPFVAVSCGAGRLKADPNLLHEAVGGTVLLDDVAELELSEQARLLRVIQGRELAPEQAPAAAPDVRILATTSRDLPPLVTAGRFRRDLYARLALSELHVPALRARRADIYGWFLRFQRAGEDVPPELDPAAIVFLLTRDWPNNLRDLQRLVHQLRLQPAAGKRTGKSDLERALGERPSAPEASAAAAEDKPPIPTRDELVALLDTHRGSVRAVAKQLARDRRQIYRWMTAYGIARRPNG